MQKSPNRYKKKSLVIKKSFFSAKFWCIFLITAIIHTCQQIQCLPIMWDFCTLKLQYIILYQYFDHMNLVEECPALLQFSALVYCSAIGAISRYFSFAGFWYTRYSQDVNKKTKKLHPHPEHDSWLGRKNINKIYPLGRANVQRIHILIFKCNFMWLERGSS